MNVDLSGKVALVTGAARGIGKAIAETLGRNGATVVSTDLDSPELFAKAEGAPAKALVMDVVNEEQVQAVVQQIRREFGRLDILVNNAGVNTGEHRVTIEKFPRHEWDRLVNIDLTGVYIVSKAVSQIMLDQGGGRIINIASVAGVIPLRLQCAYVAAKAGVVNLTRAMAIELGSRGVLTNCVAPGSIATEGTRQGFFGKNALYKDKGQQLLDHIPLGRQGTPLEIANTVLFLAAPESSYLNGSVIVVDGGWTAGYARDF